MKKHLIIILCAITCMANFLRAEEYPKVIIPGDYADPTILRDGKDFYMTHSPFVYVSGFLIWHSTDLINWQPLVEP